MWFYAKGATKFENIFCKILVALKGLIKSKENMNVNSSNQSIS